MEFLFRYKKYQSLIIYLILGFGTFLVNMFTYNLISPYLPYLWSYTLAWVIAVLFAYYTNRKWVFFSKVKGFKNICKEIFNYYSARLLTFLAGIVIMWLGVKVLHGDDNLVNILRNAGLLIPNYYLAKLYVFAK